MRFLVLETVSLLISVAVWYVVAILFGYFVFNEPIFPDPDTEYSPGDGISGCAIATFSALFALPFALWVHSFILRNFIMRSEKR